MIMGILKNLFSKKHEIEKREVLPEDIFFSPGYVYYECDDESIKNKTYKVFTLYPSLYDENSDEDFCKLCDDILYEILKDKKIIMSVKYTKTSENIVLNNILDLKKQNKNDKAVIFEYDERFLILCDINTMIFNFKQYEDVFDTTCIYEIYACKEETEILDKEQINNIIEENKYDIYLYYYKYPDYLEFKLKNGIRVNNIIENIGKACKRNKRRLFVEYETFNTME